MNVVLRNGWSRIPYSPLQQLRADQEFGCSLVGLRPSGDIAIVAVPVTGISVPPGTGVIRIDGSAAARIAAAVAGVAAGISVAGRRIAAATAGVTSGISIAGCSTVAGRRVATAATTGVAIAGRGIAAGRPACALPVSLAM